MSKGHGVVDSVSHLGPDMGPTKNAGADVSISVVPSAPSAIAAARSLLIASVVDTPTFRPIDDQTGVMNVQHRADLYNAVRLEVVLS